MKYIIFLVCSVNFWALYGQKDFKQNFASGDINALVAANINGDVVFEGIDDTDEIVMTALLNSEESDQDGQVSLDWRIFHDTLAFFIRRPCGDFRLGLSKDKGWKTGYYDWGEGCEEFYYDVDIRIVGPSRLNVDISTINEGNLSANRVMGIVSAQNINGNVEIKDAARIRSARTINGDVNIDYRVNPVTDGYYYTLNGDISLLFQEGPDAQISFKSNFGDLFTNLSDLQPLHSAPQQVKSQEGFKVILDGKSRFVAGNGGVELDFETFNGDVIIKTNEKSY